MTSIPTRKRVSYNHFHDEWERLYVDEGINCPAIARMFKCSQTTVQDALNKRGVLRRRGRARVTVPAKDRFWEKVEIASSGCWEWQGNISQRGYGSFTLNGFRTTAHRASYEMHYGDFDKSLFVCHHCDNRVCVRPDHLFLGTAQDNTDDCIAKNRLPLGEDSWGAILTEKQVLEIRRLWRGRGRGGPTQQELADRFGVSKGTVSHVVRRNTWKHI